nr:hypothetical protein [Tanacetum cinerariifolium]
MASAVICLSKGQRFNFSRYIFDSLVRNVDNSSKFYMYPHFIHLIIQAQVVDFSFHTTRYIFPALTQKVFANMRRVGKEEIADDVAQPTSPLPPSPVIPSSPPHQSPRPPPPQAAEGSSLLVQQVLFKNMLLNKVKSSKLMRLKKLGTFQRIESSEDLENVFNQGRISVDIDEGIELVVDQEKDAEIEGRQAEIYNIDLDHSSKLLSMQEDDAEVVAASTPIPAAKPAVVAVSTPISVAKPKVLNIVAAAPAVSTRKRKGVVIRDPEEKLHDDTPSETLFVKDKGKGILVEDPKPMKKKDQIEMDA